jgi:exodeoxyribonuclease VII small subunit
MATEPEVKYEEALKRLEKLVADLEKPDLDLEVRLKRFEEGTKLAALLLKRLEQAKKKVEILVKRNVGDLSLAPFNDDLADAEENADAG